MVECDIYIDRKAVLSSGDAVFMGEIEPMPNMAILNPTPSQNVKTKPETQKTHDAPQIQNENMSEASHPTNPTPPAPNEPELVENPTRSHRNSLAGLPQFNESLYGRGKCCAAAGGAHLTQCESLEPGGVEFEPNKTGSN